ncbi:methyltransferase domain-containing protein [Aliiroseovarius sp.]|uniref:methyltransferase domain-containing protein n=1 Tax=Aliiroseovarius sp. TaxID=1872442 RepID=UPI00261CA5C3|nr:methyltransferase domain-containing protein [Aliiroseovarius sp.]
MTPRHSDRVQRSFSRSFDSYHGAADQQVWVAEHLVAALRDAEAPGYFARAFEFGCGTGHLTRALMESITFDRLTLNDLMPEARATAEAHGAEFLPGDAEALTWPTPLDLVVSASTIQWLENPERILRKAATQLAPGGWLAVSGFGPDQYRELSRLGSKARAPGLCTPEALAKAVSGALDVVATGEVLRQQLFPTPLDVLRHLRHTGVNARAQGAWSKSRLARFIADYDRAFGTEDGVSLTYHPVWIVAHKPA